MIVLSTIPHLFFKDTTHLEAETVGDLVSEWEDVIFEVSDAERSIVIDFEDVESIDEVAVVAIRTFARRHGIKRFILQRIVGETADSILLGIILLQYSVHSVELSHVVFAQPEIALATLFQFTFMTLQDLSINQMDLPSNLIREWLTTPRCLALQFLQLCNIRVCGDEVEPMPVWLEGTTLQFVKLAAIVYDNNTDEDMLIEAMAESTDLAELHLESYPLGEYALGLLSVAHFRHSLEILKITNCGNMLTTEIAAELFPNLEDAQIV